MNPTTNVATIAETNHAEVKLSRGHDGKGALTATSVIPLGSHRRELHIETSKTAFSAGITCKATVQQVSEDGHFRSYAMSNRFGSGDYSRKVVVNEGARATEKAILAIHSEGMTFLDQLLQEAKLHYAGRDESATVQ